MKCDILPHLYRWWRMSLLQQDSRGHLTFMAVNREIPKYLDATLWNRGFVDTNGKYYELWNAQAQYYTSKILAICRQKPFTERLAVH